MNTSKELHKASRAGNSSQVQPDQENFDQWASAVRRQMMDALKRRERSNG